MQPRRNLRDAWAPIGSRQFFAPNFFRRSARFELPHLFIRRPRRRAPFVPSCCGSGFDVFGETEITGQVKKAYEMTRGAQLTSSILNRAFQNVFQV